MHIIYGYSNCTDNMYNKYYCGKRELGFQPSQKYHGLLIKGLSIAGAKVLCLSGLPINRSVTKKIFIHEKDEAEGNATFHYYKTINISVIRQIMIFFAAFFKVLTMKKKDEVYALCDYLSVANTYGIIFACKLKRIPIIAIVTDLTDMLNSNKLFVKINNVLLQMVDGFVFLTEQMNERINNQNKPYIVLEGHVDCSLEMPLLETKYETSCGKKVIIYAGSIAKLYGIQNLVEGFVKADISNSELRIFGDGDYRKELEQIARRHRNVLYMGNCCNQEVVEEEQKAMLLVNPRPTAPEYTLYSFPSKNMEYMVSGTPVLTTKLPGMPEEYYPYIYLIEDETAYGIAQVLEKISKEPMEERHKKGVLARKFVLENKSNIAQAKKIICFMQEKLR